MSNEKASVPSFIPSEMKGVGVNVHGFEDLDMSTMAIPFLKVLNAQSPELDETATGVYIKDAKQGDIVNSITKENYGTSIDFVVLKMEHVYVEWKPERGGLVGYHTVAEANEIAVTKTFGAWSTAEGNILQETYIYYMLIVGHEEDGVIIYSADRASLKEARKLNTWMSQKRFADGDKAPPFYQIYKASTSRRKNDKGSWYAIDFSFVRIFEEQDIDLFHRVEEDREIIADTDLRLNAPQEQKALPDNIAY